MRRLMAALVTCVALAGAPGAAAVEPSASLPDIEDEVMCPICGTLLELSEAPQAERQRVFIRTRIARGEDKEEIKDALVAEYGEEVLATPQSSGFDLAAYLVPILAILVALGAMGAAVWRWRSRGAGARESREGRPAPEGSDSDRLDADLARYDL